MNHYIQTLNAIIAYGATGETAGVCFNALGAYFHITDQKMPDGNYRAFMVTPQLRVLEGVWHSTETDVVIEWSNDQMHVYPFDVWHINHPILNKLRRGEEGVA